MFGIHYFKAAPTTFVMQFRNGQIVREGLGLSFFYFAPRSTLVAVPAGSAEMPFIFNEITGDFQEVTVQGQLIYRLADPKKLARLMDFSLRPRGAYASDDPQRLPQRISSVAQTATRAEVQSRPLRTAIIEADAIARRVQEVLAASPALQALGIESLDFAILAVKPTPDTARALEAEARERLLREADDATYGRRNNAVEQERRIRESELQTEVAVQAKQREIDQTRLEAQIALEERRKQLVVLEADNSRAKSDAEAYALEATLKPLAALDPRALQVLAARGLEPRSLVAMAFQEIASNAAKVGNLNISPELLDSLLRHNTPPQKK